VNDIVEARRPELASLCRKYGARRLDIFGSAARGDFEPSRSDLDFVVEFEELSPTQRADNYFALLAALEHLFERPVDLIELSAIRNPYFREEIEETRASLYAAS